MQHSSKVQVFPARTLPQGMKVPRVPQSLAGKTCNYPSLREGTLGSHLFPPLERNYFHSTLNPEGKFRDLLNVQMSLSPTCVRQHKFPNIHIS